MSGFNCIYSTDYKWRCTRVARWLALLAVLPPNFDCVEVGFFSPGALSGLSTDMPSGEIAANWATRLLKERALTRHSRASGRQRGNIGRNWSRRGPAILKVSGCSQTDLQCFRSRSSRLRPSSPVLSAVLLLPRSPLVAIPLCCAPASPRKL